MLGFFSRKRIAKYTDRAKAFVQKTYTEPVPAPVPKPQKKTEPFENADSNVKYSLSFPRYSLDDQKVGTAVKSMLQTGNSKEVDSLLNRATEQTFVECIIEFIRDKKLRDNKVYKAAQIDRRLYSKIMSDLHYKPSKDTALALSYALELSVDQAKDLLSRAGYSLSHSDKRDILMEFFFREKIYNITEINCILDNLGQKIIGR